MGYLYSEAISREAGAAFLCNVDEVMLLAPTALAFSKCCIEFSAHLNLIQPQHIWLLAAACLLGDFMTGDLPPVKNK